MADERVIARADREEWLTQMNEKRAETDRRFGNGLPGRMRPRDPIEAEYLRRVGTPEHLIGPVAGSADGHAES